MLAATEPVPVPGLTRADALATIAKLSPVPNVVRALDRFRLQLWVDDGTGRERGVFTTWATTNDSAESLSMQRRMIAVGLKVHLIDSACDRRWFSQSARAF